MLGLNFFFGQCGPLLGLCHTRPMTEDDVLGIPVSCTASEVLRDYQELLEQRRRATAGTAEEGRRGRQQRAARHEPCSEPPMQQQQDGPPPPTSRGDAVLDEHRLLPLSEALYLLNRRVVAFAIFYHNVIRLSGTFLQIWALSSVLKYLAGRNGDPLGVQIVWAVVMGLGAYMQSLGQHNQFHHTYRASVRARSLACSLIFRKMLLQTPLHNLPPRKRRRELQANGTDAAAAAAALAVPSVTSGLLMNLVASDANTFVEAFHFVPMLLCSIIEVVGPLVWIGHLVGWSTAVTAGIICFLLPFQLYIGSQVSRIRDQSFKLADKRLRALSEFFGGIGIVKISGWEPNVSEMILGLRAEESKLLKTGVTWRLANLCFFFFIPATLSLVTFGLQTVYRPALDPVDTFVSLALLQIMARALLQVMPRGTTSCGSALSSIRRIEGFLAQDFGKGLRLPVGQQVVPMAEGTATGTRAGRRPEQDLALVPFPREGASGDEEMTPPHQPDGDAPIVLTALPDGCLELAGNFGWNGFTLNILNMCCRPNTVTVVMGPVGSGKSTLLHAVLGNCAVRHPELSGGSSITAQDLPTGPKAAPGSTRSPLPAHTLRVPAGGTAYVPQEAWILDGTIRDNILFGLPYEAGKYRRVLHVCCLEDDLLQWGGDMVEVGEKGVTLSGGQKQRVSLARACYTDAAVLLLDDPISAVDATVAKLLLERCIRGYLAGRIVVLATHHPTPMKYAHQVLLLEDGRQVACRANEPASLPAGLSDESPASRKEVDAVIGAARTLVFAEANATGSVDSSVYATALRSGGFRYLLLFAAILLLSQSFRNVGDWWFAAWTRQRFNDTLSPRAYVLIYLGLVLGMMVFGMLRAVSYTTFILRSSTAMHNTMFDRVLRSPMHFFESVPLGRVLNRFSKDVDCCDELLPRVSFDFIQLFLTAIGSVALLIYSVPYFAIATFVFAVMFLRWVRFYLPSARYLKRIEASSRSPSMQLLQSTFAGLPVLRPYGVDTLRYRAFVLSLDRTSRALMTADACQRWMGTRMDLVAALSVVVMALLVVLLKEEVGVSLAGMALGQALMLTGALQFSVRMAAETESTMTSVERIVEYGCLPCEANNGTLTPANWPQTPTLVVKHLSVAHVSNPSEMVLQNLSFAIGAGEKVAIVGRTGAGKSTLLNCFLRMLPIPADTVFIDGVSTTALELSFLRQRLGVIPQAPTLFQGSIRRNLDPFGRFSDDALVDALVKVRLDGLLDDRGGLEADIGEAGSSMSVGQKQLLCAARALLLQPKILFMDEATANVDAETDANLQHLIRHTCKDVTVVTIAHRLHTIMDYDRVLVLARGRLVESGKPSELARLDPANPANVFASMVQAMTAVQGGGDAASIEG